MKLRDYQQEVVNSIFNFVMTQPGHPVAAMPTGTGKSLVIGGGIHQFMQYYPRTRHLMLTHVKELVEQNANKLTQLWAGAPLGINCAGLRRKDIMHPIIYGSIGTSSNYIDALGHRDFCWIDECQAVNPEDGTMYYDAMRTLHRINPNIRFIGTSATIFRLKQGLVTNNGIFTDVCIDLTDIESFNRFIAEGYLVPLYPKSTETQFDISNVKISQGDYSLKQLQEAVDKNAITRSALEEVIEIGRNRHSWLIFSSGVEHAIHISDILNDMGIKAASVHNKCSNQERDNIIKDFKFGKYKALVNNNILTTGFDHPWIDLIACLRPTISPGLWVQMLGRGTRPVYEPGFNLDTIEGRLQSIAASCKQNTIVLDFAGNTMSLGPINDPRIPKQKDKGKGEAPAKKCDNCNTYNHTKATHCICCGQPFTFRVKIDNTASTAPLIAETKKEVEIPVVNTFDVTRVIYNKIRPKHGGSPLIRVTYICNFLTFDEYLSFDSAKPYARHLARDWWRSRYAADPPIADEFSSATDKVLKLVSELKTPIRIRVWVNHKPQPKVLSYEYE